MKLLDWMQHKFRQTNNEHLTEFSPRKSCTCPSLDDLQYYPKSNYYAKAPNNTTQRGKQLRKSFACIETARADDEKREEEESAAAFSEIFHGFLAIGTLNMTTEPATPTFATSVENIMEKASEATENELKLVNDELEKVLAGKEEDHANESSGRNSCVSVGRSSYGSSITLGDNNENGGSVVCPLQGYLYGSVVGLQETSMGRKEHRASLGELFQRTKTVDEDKISKGERQKEKETDKSAVNLMKKILKGRTRYSSSRRSTSASCGTTTDPPASADKKPRKILQMFHRKVHPEGPTAAHKPENRKHVTVGNFTNEEEYNNRNQMVSGDIMLFPMLDNSTKGAANCTKSNRSRSICCTNDSDGNRECWIKSDADYLVLEL